MKILFIVEELNQEILNEKILINKNFIFKEKNELVLKPALIEEYEVTLDCTFNNIFFNYVSQNGNFGFITNNEFKRNETNLNGSKIFQCENLSFIIKKENINKIPECKQQIRTFIDFLTRLDLKLNPDPTKDLEFKCMFLENEEEYIIVKKIPEKKEEGKKYLKFEDLKELNRIFDIIDALEERG